MATRRKKLVGNGTRAVVYVRVSTDKQVESGLGLEDQQERLAAYCKLRGLELVQLVIEPGESAGKPLASRPGGQKLLELVRRKKVDAVVILKLDRAFRDTVDTLVTVEAWDKAGVALHITDLGGMAIDTGTATGKMILTMLAGFAEFERNQTGERTTAALAHKARSGSMRTNSTPPYGWRYEGEQLVEVPKEQVVVGLVRRWHGAGWSFRAIVRGLVTEGHRNRAGTEFKLTQIHRMLQGSVRQMHERVER